MSRGELWEWVGLIAVILAWWPAALLGYWATWYQVAVIVFSVAVLAWVTMRRVAQVREGLRYSKEVMETTRPGAGHPGKQDRAGKRD